jgi:hypothetical protein
LGGVVCVVVCVVVCLGMCVGMCVDMCGLLFRGYALCSMLAHCTIKIQFIIGRYKGLGHSCVLFDLMDNVQASPVLRDVRHTKNSLHIMGLKVV